MTASEIANNRRQELERMVQAGSKLTREGFAKHFDVSMNAIWGDLRAIHEKNGEPLKVCLKRAKNGPSPQKIYAIKQDYIKGASLNDLAKKYRYGIRRLSDILGDMTRPNGRHTAPVPPKRYTAEAGGATVTADCPKRAEAFLKAYRAGRKGKASKTGNRPGVTPSQERAYAAAICASLGGVKGKAA